MYTASTTVTKAFKEYQGILYTDVSTGQLMPFCHADGLQWSSAGAPWQDVLQVEEHRVSPQETGESAPQDHCIIMHRRRPGKVECRIAGGKSHCRVCFPGDLHLSSQGVPRWGRWYQEMEFLLIALDPAFVETVAASAAHVDRIAFTNRCAFQDPAIEHIMLALRAELLAGCPAGRLYGESLATALAVHLLRRYTAFPPKQGDPRGGLPPAQLRRVLDYMHTHLGEDLSLRQLANVVQLSPHHFATLFKQSTGLAPHQYLLRQRIATAQHLLAGQALSLAEISCRLGFSTQAHFTTMFRKLVGTTPGAYRKDHQGS